MGDPVSGPSIVFAEIPPRSQSSAGSPLRRLKQRGGEFLPVPITRPLRTVLSHRGGHFHRSDTFRMVVGDCSKHSFSFGRRWHYPGDYRLQSSNHPYREWHGSHGCLEMIVDADRRGHAPIDGSVRHVDDTERLRSVLDGVGSYLSQLPTFFTEDEDAIFGLATTTAGRVLGPGLSGSFKDRDWTHLSDGSQVLGLVMGDREKGPLILLSRNAPNAVESQRCSYSTEMLRIVLTGHCMVGDRIYGPGSLLLTDVGVEQDAVVHGPAGSTQFLFFTDRRGWLPDTSFIDGPLARWRELEGLLDPLLNSSRLVT